MIIRSVEQEDQWHAPRLGEEMLGNVVCAPPAARRYKVDLRTAALRSGQPSGRILGSSD